VIIVCYGIDMGASGTLASASLDGTVALWDINTHQRHHLLKGHRRGVCMLHLFQPLSLPHSCDIYWYRYSI
jgi:WD40 repeat protein